MTRRSSGENCSGFSPQFSRLPFQRLFNRWASRELIPKACRRKPPTFVLSSLLPTVLSARPRTLGSSTCFVRALPAASQPKGPVISAISGALNPLVSTVEMGRTFAWRPPSSAALRAAISSATPKVLVIFAAFSANGRTSRAVNSGCSVSPPTPCPPVPNWLAMNEPGIRRSPGTEATLPKSSIGLEPWRVAWAMRLGTWGSCLASANSAAGIFGIDWAMVCRSVAASRYQGWSGSPTTDS